MLVDVPTQAGPAYRQAAHPVRFSATKPAYRHAGVTLGNDSEAVLAQCGYTDGEIAALFTEGVVSGARTPAATALAKR